MEESPRIPSNSRRRRNACLLCFLIGVGSTVARDADPPKEPDAPLGWRQARRDTRYVLTRPWHLDRRGWTRVAWVAGTTAALYLVREEVRDAAQRNRNEPLESILDGARNMGKGASVPIVALGFYLSGRLGGSGYRTETAQILLESVSISFFMAGVGNTVLAAERPEEGDSVRFLDTDGHGVSGDVSIAASMLAPIVDRHLRVTPQDSRGRRFWKRFGAWGLYGTAGLVALQRIHSNDHYLPDVFLGYANGLTMGRLIVDSRRGGREWRDRPGRVTVRPAPGGLRITWGARPATASRWTRIEATPGSRTARSGSPRR